MSIFLLNCEFGDQFVFYGNVKSEFESNRAAVFIQVLLHCNTRLFLKFKIAFPSSESSSGSLLNSAFTLSTEFKPSFLSFSLLWYFIGCALNKVLISLVNSGFYSSLLLHLSWCQWNVEVPWFWSYPCITESIETIINSLTLFYCILQNFRILGSLFKRSIYILLMVLHLLCDRCIDKSVHDRDGLWVSRPFSEN